MHRCAAIAGLTILCFGLLAGNDNASASTQQPASPSKPTTTPRPVLLNGDWTGTLRVGDSQLHLILHLTGNARGDWHATLDSLDQAVYGMEAAKVTRSEDALEFDLPSVGASFQGKIQPDRKSIRGIWQQGGSALPLQFEKRAAGALANSSAKAVSKAEGTWQGAIEFGNMRMRLQLHISHDDKRELLASVDSLDQGIQGIPASRVSESAGEMKFELSAFDAEYSGSLDSAKNKISGHWSQNGNNEKLNFHRSDRPLELRRPQNPVKPYPYREEEISFASGNPPETLAGTLTLPQGAGPFPVAVLLGGASPTDRDETVAGHKPFLLLADFLTKSGIAVLRYDKRGIAQSKGDFPEATIETFSQDAQSALTYLKSRKELDPKRFGMIGHGEGGMIASLVATRTNDVAWLVLLATPATIGEKTLLRQSELIARAGGLPEDQIARSLEFDRKAYAAVREEKDSATLQKRLDTLVQQSGLSEAVTPAALQAQIRFMVSPWFRQFLDYDPQPALDKLRCPVLALSGDRDLQVDSQENVPLLRKASDVSENKDFTVVEIEGVNHLFQTAQSGSPALYGAIEETIAPQVLTALGNWVTKHSGL
jgi:pimeloyl-ACP methyl ester carboxylesterase